MMKWFLWFKLFDWTIIVAKVDLKQFSKNGIHMNILLITLKWIRLLSAACLEKLECRWPKGLTLQVLWHEPCEFISAEIWDRGG